MEDENLQPIKNDTTDINKSVNFYDLYSKKNDNNIKNIQNKAKIELDKALAPNEAKKSIQITSTSLKPETKIDPEQKSHTYKISSKIPVDYIKEAIKEHSMGQTKDNSTNKTTTELKNKPEKSSLQRDTVLRSLRTYKDDLTQAMIKNKASVVSIVSAENVRRVENRDTINNPITIEEKHYLKKISIVVLSTIFIVIGAGSALYFYGKNNVEPVNPKAKIESVVFAEKEEDFNITNLSRRQILNELNVIKNNTQLTKGEIKNILITKTFTDEQGLQKQYIANAKDFLRAIDIHTSESFIRSLNQDFMVGIHMFDNNQPFMIFKTGFYENVFAGMFEWEKHMKDDLAPFFGSADAIIPIEPTGTSTPIAIPTFNDIVIKNQDARVLKDENGKTLLIYSFIDKQTVVITTNENTLGEVLVRSKSSKSK